MVDFPAALGFRQQGGRMLAKVASTATSELEFVNNRRAAEAGNPILYLAYLKSLFTHYDLICNKTEIRRLLPSANLKVCLGQAL